MIPAPSSPNPSESQPAQPAAESRPTPPQNAGNPPAPEPEPPSAEEKPKIPREAQSKAIQNFIGRSYTQLQTATTDEALAMELGKFGYDKDEYEAGAELLRIAADAFEVRFTGLGGERKTQADLDTAEESAREDYLQFRTIARGCFPKYEDQAALGLVGRLSQDFEVFLNRAQASYANAKKAPWSTKLTRRGYSVERLDGLATALDSLVGRFGEAAKADGVALKSTADRDKAYKDLRDFMKEFKAVARGVFRKQPDALKKLGL